MANFLNEKKKEYLERVLSSKPSVKWEWIETTLRETVLTYMDNVAKSKQREIGAIYREAYDKIFK